MTPGSLWIAVVAVLPVIGGGALALQAGVNATLARGAGSGVWAAAVSFVVGAAALLAVVAALRLPPWPEGVASATPAWAWVGGLLGAAYVTSAALAASRVGAGATIALAVAGQVVVSLGLDHFGLAGVPSHPASAGRLAGAALVMAGAALVKLA
jgi:transporter family-2 protein